MEHSTYYFDYNASTPVDSEVYQSMEPFLKADYGNPSSIHQMGKIARKALNDARRKVAALLGACDEREIVFTSGGTESNNAAVHAALKMFPDRRSFITTTVEHSSVYNIFRDLEKKNYRVHWLRVDSQGRLDIEELNTYLQPDTALVSIMMANNETGVLFPIKEIGALLRDKGVLFHVDAVQAAGKMPVELGNTSIDLLSISAHKFYGPKGAGALYTRQAEALPPLMLGGAQERGRRAGTENVAGIVGLGTACELAKKNCETEAQRLRMIRDRFEKTMKEKIKGVFVNGGETERLCGTSNLSFKNTDGEALLFALDQRGIYASSGSACMSGSREPSRVLKAMGYSGEEANSSVRFSFGRQTTESSVEDAARIIAEIVERVREADEPHCHAHAPAGMNEPQSD